MNKITAFMDGMDLSKLVPELDQLLKKVSSIAGWAVFLCPLLVLTLGLCYLLKSPKEANHGFGFRTYYAMGSVQAWQFSQRVAGMGYMALGGALTILMGLVSLIFRGKAALSMITIAAVCVLIELILILALWVGLNLLIFRAYDKDGNRRKKT